MAFKLEQKDDASKQITAVHRQVVVETDDDLSSILAAVNEVTNKLWRGINLGAINVVHSEILPKGKVRLTLQHLVLERG